MVPKNDSRDLRVVSVLISIYQAPLRRHTNRIGIDGRRPYQYSEKPFQILADTFLFRML